MYAIKLQYRSNPVSAMKACYSAADFVTLISVSCARLCGKRLVFKSNPVSASSASAWFSRVGKEKYVYPKYVCLLAGRESDRKQRTGLCGVLPKCTGFGCGFALLEVGFRSRNGVLRGGERGAMGVCSAPLPDAGTSVLTGIFTETRGWVHSVKRRWAGVVGDC